MARVRYDDAEHVARREYMREWNAKNWPRISVRRKELLQDPVRHAKKLAADAAWRLANPEKHLAASVRWVEEHPDQYRANMRVAQHKRRALTEGGKVTAGDWADILSEAGGKCLKCGNTTSLEIDHVVPLSLGGPHSRDNIQVLCRSCNARKGARTEDWRI